MSGTIGSVEYAQILSRDGNEVSRLGMGYPRSPPLTDRRHGRRRSAQCGKQLLPQPEESLPVKVKILPDQIEGSLDAFGNSGTRMFRRLPQNVEKLVGDDSS